MPAIVINTQLGVNYTVHIFTTHLFPTSFGTILKLVGFVHWFPMCRIKTRTGTLAMRQKAVKKKEKAATFRADLVILWLRSQGPKGRRKDQGPPRQGDGEMCVAESVWRGSPFEHKYTKKKYGLEDSQATRDFQGILSRHCPHCLWHGR